MTVRKWEKEYKTWMGTAAELAAVAQKVIESIGMKDPEVRPNERLIRHYAQMGILDRADRKGREAFFGFRQLAQYLVARNLALDGWPLAKIAEFINNSDLPGLLDLIPKPVRQKNVVVAKTFAHFGQDAKQQTRKRPDLKQLTEITLTSWCRVHIDQSALHDLSPKDAELIGKALTRVLKDNRRGK